METELMENKRLDKLESDMMGLHEEVKTNTALTKEVKDSVVELLEMFNSFKGFWKVLEYVGKAAKPLAWVAGLSTMTTIWWHDLVKLFRG